MAEWTCARACDAEGLAGGNCIYFRSSPICSSSSSFFFSLVYSIHTAIPLAFAFVYASPSHQTKLALIVLGEHFKYTLSLTSSRFGECFVSLADDPQKTLPSAYLRLP